VGFYAFLIVFVSIYLFILTTTAGQVGDLITEQNALALKLWPSLEYYRDHYGKIPNPPDKSLPPELFSTLVQFSRGNGEIIKILPRLKLRPFTHEKANPECPSDTDNETANDKKYGSATGMLTSWQEAKCHFKLGGAFDKQYVKNPKDFDHYGIDPHTDTENVVDQGMYQIELYQMLRDYALEKSNSYKSAQPSPHFFSRDFNAVG
jgi:hypothetical protein